MGSINSLTQIKRNANSCLNPLWLYFWLCALLKCPVSTSKYAASWITAWVATGIKTKAEKKLSSPQGHKDSEKTAQPVTELKVRMRSWALSTSARYWKSLQRVRKALHIMWGLTAEKLLLQERFLKASQKTWLRGSKHKTSLSCLSRRSPWSSPDSAASGSPALPGGCVAEERSLHTRTDRQTHSCSLPLGRKKWTESGQRQDINAECIKGKTWRYEQGSDWFIKSITYFGLHVIL